ncbi:hypothetical protein N7499_003023 [Penicillium canescens]|uniref:Uncharacterized protein n=1 Tax=Penicillium canescens TaxID=5083 RepID=A0AAD6N854_PENCN|nr:uncharacterized protein N7446_011901 [Penicillium canescens]KAJ6003547.1 hypothetical protein N7522_006239 [Penicillium canescens]KAJ6039158.1 hypothetical protein N7460_007190 [Penicillium canescens]KAJ6047067.1 hypothetical protein N7446_011901 [Penicillium canescens]KAJ6059815.1 hypothetical protein N7444_003454 [Penicillium canescens]KAJ6093692.1 hypothetical protein N7499_003023 [Penicillium canescens]
MESLLKEQDALLEEVAVVLLKLKTKLGLRGTTSSSTWESVKLLMPDTWKLVRFFKNHYTTTLDFNNLESCVEQIKKKISKYKENFEDLSEHEVNFNALSDMNKLCAGFEIAHILSQRDLLLWEHTRVMMLFPRCLLFSFGGGGNHLSWSFVCW